MLNDFGKSTVTIKKPELLEAIKNNRDSHQSEFEDAVKGYREAAIKQLTSMLDEATNGKVIRRGLDLIEPISHVKDYDRVIRMLEMSMADEIQITEQQFSQFVLDEWSWSQSFKVSTSGYNNGGNITSGTAGAARLRG